MKPARPVRIADVVPEARVGTAAVDRDLNDRYGASEAMERRVRRVMDNVVARKPEHMHDRPPARQNHDEVLLPGGQGSRAVVSFAISANARQGEPGRGALFVRRMDEPRRVGKSA